MTHKLLIRHMWRPTPVREEALKIKFVVENIGEEVFSGGKISSVRVYLPEGITIILMPEKMPILPEIKPNSSYEIEPLDFFPIREGLARVEVKVEAYDNKPIEYFQNPASSTGEIWKNFMYIRKKEDQIIISLLEKLIGILSKRENINNSRQ